MTALNFAAAKAAQSATAFGVAKSYFEKADKIINPEIYRILALKVTVGAWETSYFLENREESTHHFEKALKLAVSLEEKVEVYRKYFRQISFMHEHSGIERIGEMAFQLFDEEFPFTTDNVVAAKVEEDHRITELMNGRSILSLRNLPPAKDKFVHLQLLLMIDIAVACYNFNALMCIWIMRRSARLVIEHGHMDGDAFAWSVSALLSAEQGNLAEASMYDALTEHRVKQSTLGDKYQITIFQLGFVSPWFEPAATVMRKLASYIAELEPMGRHDLVEYGIVHRIIHSYFSAMTYETFNSVFLEHSVYIYQKLDMFGRSIINMIFHRYEALAGNSIGGMTSLDTSSFNASELVAECEKNSFKMTAVYAAIMRSELNYLAGEYEESIHQADMAITNKMATPAQNIITQAHFFRGMSRANFPHKSEEIEKDIKMFRTWARYCPDSSLVRLLLLLAEQRWQKGDHRKSIRFFDSAIKQAQKKGNLFEIALANERLGTRYYETGATSSAHYHLQESLKQWKVYGAKAKAEQLETIFPFLQKTVTAPSVSLSEVTGLLLSRKENESKLSIVLRDAIKRCKATEGAIFFKCDDSVKIETAITASELGSSLPKHMSELALSPNKFVSYVFRSGKVETIPDTSSKSGFFENSEIQRSGKKIAYSVVGIPLKTSTNVHAVLYLSRDKPGTWLNTNDIGHMRAIATIVALQMEVDSLKDTFDKRLNQKTKEVEQVNIRLQNEKSRAEEAVDIKNRFISLAAHDLSGPLATLHKRLKIRLLRVMVTMKSRFGFSISH